MKRCAGPCNQVKENQKFYKKIYKNGTIGLRSYCIDCGNIMRNDWRAKNKDHDNARNTAYNKENRLKIKGHKLVSAYWPKMSWSEALSAYNFILNLQNQVCKICGKQESRLTSEGKPRDLAVDHCHATGKVRGLLCNKCNRGIGLLNHNLTFLTNAVSYLKETLMEQSSYYSAIDNAFAKLTEEIKKEKEEKELQDE